MKITRRQLLEIINKTLKEDRFDDYSTASPDEGMIAHAKAKLAAVRGSSAYINVDPDHLFSVAGGTNPGEIKNLNPYILDVLRLLCLNVFLSFVGKGDSTSEAIDKTRRMVIVTSSYRDEENQVQQLKTKLEDAKSSMSDQEAIEAVGRLYSPDDGDHHMTKETHETALSALEMINNGDVSGAISLVRSNPISMHQSYNSIDLRSAGGRKDFIMHQLDELVRTESLDDSAVYYNYEPPEIGPAHVHMSVSEKDPIPPISRKFLDNSNPILNKLIGSKKPPADPERSAYDYYDGAAF